MIHSLCGGKRNMDDTRIFAKVRIDENECESQNFGWYLADDFHLKIGDKVIVKPNYINKSGVVVEIKECKNKIYPVPLRTAKSIVSVVYEQN